MPTNLYGLVFHFTIAFLSATKPLFTTGQYRAICYSPLQSISPKAVTQPVLYQGYVLFPNYTSWANRQTGKAGGWVYANAGGIRVDLACTLQLAHVSAKARAWLGQISRSLRPHTLTPGSRWTHRRGWGWGWQRWGWWGGAQRRPPLRASLESSLLPKEEFPGARSTQDWPMGDTTTGRLHPNFHRGSTTRCTLSVILLPQSVLFQIRNNLLPQSIPFQVYSTNPNYCTCVAYNTLISERHMCANM